MTSITKQVKLTSLNINLYDSTSNAEVIQSPNAVGNVIIPQYVECDGKRYKITRIGDNAFQRTSINSLSFDKNSHVNYIGNCAFEASKLTSLSLPSSLSEVGKEWCKGCNKVNEINVDENNTIFFVQNDFLIKRKSYKNNELVFAKRNISGNVQIPKNIKKIGSYAFDHCKKIESVTNFQGSFLKVIDSYSFNQCTNLQKLSFSTKSNMEIKKYSFSDCLSIKSICIKAAILKIEPNTFKNCSLISSVQIKCTNDITIFNDSIDDSIPLQFINITTDSTLYLDHECFDNADNLFNIEFNANKIFLNDVTFDYCKNLSFVSLMSKNDIEISPRTFEKCNNLNEIQIVSSEKLTLLKDSFKGFNNMKKFSLESKKIEVGDNCFNDCSSLFFAVISGAESICIGKEQFINCKNLHEIRIFSKSETEFDNNFFNGAYNLISLSITSNRVFIHNDSLNIFPALLYLKIEASEIKIYPNQFNNCKNLKQIEFKSDSLVDIGSNCFDQCNELKEIKIASKRIIIGEKCFNECISIKSISFNCADEIKLNKFAFHKCISIRELAISAESLLQISDNCFENNENLQNVKLNAREIIVLKEAFKNCQSLFLFQIGKNNLFEPEDDDKSINKISRVILGAQVFANLKNLIAVWIHAKSTVNFGNKCFSKAKLLNFVQIKSKNIIFGAECFEYCSELSQIHVPICSFKMFSENYNKMTRATLHQTETLNDANLDLEINSA